ncbi:MAG: HupE/UreJ family protein, partial [Bacteroidetes bacterium]|nr:HupE/UreJ family protein [Bacteroidota bacterium]
MPGSGTDVVLRIELADGRHLQAVLSGSRGSFRVPERDGRLPMLVDYAALGVGHILTGLDHLLFVLGLLLLLVRGRRRLRATALMGTITTFTVGHSLTLSLAVLGVVAFSAPLVEVLIAGSLLVLASQLAQPASAPPRGRTPWALALGFGAAKIFYDTFANSAAVEAIAGEMPFDTAADLLLYNIDAIRELAIAVSPIAVIFLLLNVYLTGGILAAMDAQARMTWAAFFAACGKFFFPIIGVTVLTAILAGLLIVLPYIGLDKLHGIVTENAATSQTSFIFTWVWWVIVALLASWVLRVHDYARILLVTEPGRKLFTT